MRRGLVPATWWVVLLVRGVDAFLYPAPHNFFASSREEHAVCTASDKPRRPSLNAVCSLSAETLGSDTAQHHMPMESDPSLRYGVQNQQLLRTMRTAAMHGDIEGAEAALTELRHRGCVPDLRALTQVMQAYVEGKDAIGARHMMTRMKEAGYEPDIVPYSMLLALHADRGQVAAAEEVFKQIEAQGQADVKMFALLMKAYLRLRSVEGAEEVLYRMACAGEAPSTHTYSILLKTYAKKGDIMGAEDVMRRVRISPDAKPTTVMWNTLLKAYLQKGRVREVGRLLQRMRDDGVVPDVTTTMLVGSNVSQPGEGRVNRKSLPNSSRAPQPTRVLSMEDSMVQRLERGERVEEKDVVDVVRKYVEENDVEGARRAIRRLKGEITVELQNLVMHYYARHGKTEKAEQLLKELRAAGLEPDLSTYNTLLHAYAKRGARSNHLSDEDYARAMQVYSSLRAGSHGMLPDSYSITAIARCVYAKGGPLLNRKFQEVLSDMRRFLPMEDRSSQVYASMIMLAGAAGDVRMVRELYQEAGQQVEAGTMGPRAFGYVRAAHLRAVGSAVQGNERRVVDMKEGEFMSASLEGIGEGRAPRSVDARSRTPVLRE